MKHNDQDQLLNEVFGGERLEAFRQATLERGLGALRHRRRRNRITKLCALACLPLIATLLFLLKETLPAKRVAILPTKDLPSVPAPNPNRAVKIINDEELFALFPNRSMALVGKPGHQQLVFLDWVWEGR